MKALRPHLVIGVSVIIFIILLVSLAQEMNRRLQIQREVQRLQQEVQAMEKNVIALENLNKYFRTDAYQERLAREKLNYQAPGEKVVLIPEDDPDVPTKTTNLSVTEGPISIPERWWRAFFVPEPSPTPINPT